MMRGAGRILLSLAVLIAGVTGAEASGGHFYFKAISPSFERNATVGFRCVKDAVD